MSEFVTTYEPGPCLCCGATGLYDKWSDGETEPCVYCNGTGYSERNLVVREVEDVPEEVEEDEVIDYYLDNPTPEEYKAEFEEWLEEYEQVEFLEYSDENWEKVQAMDTRYVWTDHTTCEDPRVSNGAHLFKNSCCWDTSGWYIMKKPWEGDDDAFLSVNTGAYLPCTLCNRSGEEEEFNESCEECEGDGWVNHWFD